MISFDEFKKVEITVGKILTAEKVPETDKLLKLSVDFGGNTNVRTPDTNVRTEENTTTSQILSSPTTPSVGTATPPRAGGEENTTTPASGHPSSTVEGKRERDVRQIISGIAAHFPDPKTLVGRKCMFVTNLEPRVIRGLRSNGMLFAVSTEDGRFSLLEPDADIPEGTRAK